MQFACKAIARLSAARLSACTPANGVKTADFPPSSQHSMLPCVDAGRERDARASGPARATAARGDRRFRAPCRPCGCSPRGRKPFSPSHRRRSVYRSQPDRAAAPGVRCPGRSSADRGPCALDRRAEPDRGCCPTTRRVAQRPGRGSLAGGRTNPTAAMRKEIAAACGWRIGRFPGRRESRPGSSGGRHGFPP
jgi:hypothetical protein